MTPSPRTGRPHRLRIRRSGGPVLLVLLLYGALAGCADAPASPSTGSTETPSSTRTERSWPDAGTTGANGPLKERPGETISVDGTVITDVRFTGQVTVAADNVVLRNVAIDSDEHYVLLVAGENLLIEDATLRGVPGNEAALTASEGGQFVARRIDVANTTDGVRLGDRSRLVDSYVHDLAASPDSHNDAVTADGYSDWVIRHNTIYNQLDQTAAVWVGDARYGGSSGALVDNLIAGGGYAIYAGPGVGQGIRVEGNVFSTRFHPDAGSYGVVTGWEPAGNLWRDNTWADGPGLDLAVLP